MDPHREQEDEEKKRETGTEHRRHREAVRKSRRKK